MRLTNRDEAILQTLALRVRLFSLEQLVTSWWTPTDTGTSNARKRMNKLADAGLVEPRQVQAKPLPSLDSPVIAWRPGDDAPDFGAVAWTLDSRWTEPARTTGVYVATRRAANQFGSPGNGRLRQPFQVTHDLGVSAIYLRLLSVQPELARDWIGEDAYARTAGGGKIPDAVILAGGMPKLGSAPPKLAIEFGGAYPKERVRDFHEECELRGLPYMLW